jgi:hypothetical protein
VGMFLCLYLASQKPSEREFFVPARMGLTVKLFQHKLREGGESIRRRGRIDK